MENRGDFTGGDLSSTFLNVFETFGKVYIDSPSVKNLESLSSFYYLFQIRQFTQINIIEHRFNFINTYTITTHIHNITVGN